MSVGPSATTDNTEKTAATSAQFTTEAAQNTTDTTQVPSVEHTTLSNMTVVRDPDHDHGSFNASNIDPFSQEVNGSLYRNLLVRILDGMHSK
jgi:hypothetical protein